MDYPEKSIHFAQKSLSAQNSYTSDEITNFENDKNSSSGRKRWQAALQKLKSGSVDLDSWSDFQLNSVPTQTATRHRYSVIKKKWFQDEISIKLESEAFDRGAMRECFRMKKMPENGDWHVASNYVTKRYLSAVDKSVYFADVRLQMEAKLWAEAFNRQNPPKKVDIFQMSVLEIKRDTSETSFYHIERYMDGEYRKYNSNSGFVNENLRNTPQAFSHFTFERSGHRLLVVDIQGVGDLYTDPQIHTHDGVGYNDGNLGIRGIALFFHSHRCNPLCAWLGLTPFDLSSSEESALLVEGDSDLSDRDEQLNDHEESETFCKFLKYTDVRPKSTRKRSLSFGVGLNGSLSGTTARFNRKIYGPTVVKGYELYPALYSPNEARSYAPSSAFFGRKITTLSRERNASGDSGFSFQSNNCLTMHCCSSPEYDHLSLASSLSPGFQEADFNENETCAQESIAFRFNQRFRNISESSDVDDMEFVRLAANHLHQIMHETHKSSSASHPSNLDQEIGQSVLGQIHHELARLHEAGRFAASPCDGLFQGNCEQPLEPTDSGRLLATIDWESLLFHERHAAQLGCLEALIVMAHYHLGLPTQLLSDCPLQASEEDFDIGVDYLWRSSEGGDRRCMILLARYLDASICFAGRDHYTNCSLALKSRLQLVTTPANAYLALLSAKALPAFAPATCERPWPEAVAWYRRAVSAAAKQQDEGFDAEGRYDAAEDLLPVHRLLARMAEMYLSGGHGLTADLNIAGELFTEAAESAMRVKEGRLAAKYFEMADEAYSKCE